MIRLRARVIHWKLISGLSRYAGCLRSRRQKTLLELNKRCSCPFSCRLAFLYLLPAVKAIQHSRNLKLGRSLSLAKPQRSYGLEQETAVYSGQRKVRTYQQRLRYTVYRNRHPTSSGV